MAGDGPEFFSLAAERFSIAGPLATEAQINAVFSESFAGKGDLVAFYTRFNGGSRSPQGCVVSCNDPEHRVGRDELDKLIVEGFRSIPMTAEDRMLPFANILRHHATMERTYSTVSGMKEFCAEHLEIAFDHSGNDLCISQRNGRLYFMDWAAYSQGPIEIASSFREFVEKFWIAADGIHH